jgi:hypothetical protein
MTDREMLELAAKAAGVPLSWPYDPATYARFDGVPPRRTDTWENWNPLADDGDALRLAVKLMLRIDVDKTACVVFHTWKEIAKESVGTDPLAATRRAITRAAAEMPKEQK